jgi:hypothetical protein
MKKFFLMVFLAAIFFTGLGSMISKTAAKYKSDDKALALLAKARQAIGGDNAVAGVSSMIITGKSTRTFKTGDTTNTEQDDMELSLQFPDKMMKIVKMGDGTGANGQKAINKQVDVVVISDGGEPGNFEWKTEDGAKVGVKGEHTFVIRKDEGQAEQGDTASATSGQKIVIRKVDGGSTGEASPAGVAGEKNVFFNKEVKGGTPGEFPWQTGGLQRTALSLLLTAPQGMDVAYLYGGEGNVDGAACNIIDAQFGGNSVRLYLGKDSNLPVMMSYVDAKPMMVWFRHEGNEVPDAEKGVKTFERHAGPPETAEFQVKFSDYRNVNGIQLPYKWVQTVGGQPDETIDVTGYEINPANIAEKFKSNGETKMLVRTMKAPNQ